MVMQTSSLSHPGLPIDPVVQGQPDQYVGIPSQEEEKRGIKEGRREIEKGRVGR